MANFVFTTVSGSTYHVLNQHVWCTREGATNWLGLLSVSKSRIFFGDSAELVLIRPNDGRITAESWVTTRVVSIQDLDDAPVMQLVAA